MNLKNVTVEGGSGRLATFVREPSELTITSLHFPVTTINEANATDETIWRIATMVQTALDGVKGCGGDIRPYQSLISEMLQS